MLAQNRVKRIALIGGLIAVLIVLGIWFFLPAPAPGEIQGRAWQLVAAETADGSGLWTPTPGLITLRFEGYQVGGQAVCNSYGGNARYFRLTNSLAIDSVFSTLMACSGPDGQPLVGEAEFLEAIGKVNSYALRDGRLLLYYDGGSKRLVFN